MKIIELNFNSLNRLSNKLSNFFENNKSDYYFHPHNLNFDTLLNIIKATTKDFYGIFMNNNNNIIGYGILRGWDEGYNVPSLGILIDKNYRNKGYSKKIMKELHNIAKIRGASTIRLTVLKENLTAINLYKNIGYKLLEKDKNNLIGFKQI